MLAVIAPTQPGVVAAALPGGSGSLDCCAALAPQLSLLGDQQQQQQQQPAIANDVMPAAQQQQQHAQVSASSLKQQFATLRLQADQVIASVASMHSSPHALPQKQPPQPQQPQQLQSPLDAASDAALAGAAAVSDAALAGAAAVSDTAPAGAAAAAATAAAAAPPPQAPPGGSGRARRRSSRCERKQAASAPVSGYSTDSYWNSRYAEKSTHFDWFFNYSALAALINATCDRCAGPMLHVGCGNSALSDGMAEDGYRVSGLRRGGGRRARGLQHVLRRAFARRQGATSVAAAAQCAKLRLTHPHAPHRMYTQVVNVDISPVVIDQMRAMEQAPGQTWEVADCRSMPQYGDGSFGSVLDKGTLDAVLCSSHGTLDGGAYMDEVYRLLTPGGTFLLISLGQPQARLAVLHAAPASSGAAAAALPYLSPMLQQRVAAQAAAAAAAAAVAAGGSSDPIVAAAAAKPWSWERVEVFLLPKPALYLQSESSLTGKPIASSRAQADKDAPVHWLGPFLPGAELERAIAEQQLDLRGYFTAFACAKPAAAPATAATEGASSGFDACAAIGDVVTAAAADGPAA
jgi:SAM-dependent methyltransferase